MKEYDKTSKVMLLAVKYGYKMLLFRLCQAFFIIPSNANSKETSVKYDILRKKHSGWKFHGFVPLILKLIPASPLETFGFDIQRDSLCYFFC